MGLNCTPIKYQKDTYQVIFSMGILNRFGVIDSIYLWYEKKRRLSPEIMPLSLHQMAAEVGDKENPF
jgi:hypothetical protein